MNHKLTCFIISCMLILILAGCRTEDEKITLTVLAAASLSEVYSELEKGFEAKYPNINLEFSFAGTATLVTQVKEGIDSDVFVSANESSINELIDSGFIQADSEKVFAHNKPMIMVNKNTSYKVQSLEDLLQEGVKVVIAEPSQPIGKYTEEILKKIDQENLFNESYSESFYNHVVSKENSVKAVAVKVEMGEADAGIVYATDFTATNQELVYKVEILESVNLIATYELATLKNSKHTEKANLFVEYVLGDEGKGYLAEHGFLLPE